MVAIEQILKSTVPGTGRQAGDKLRGQVLVPDMEARGIVSGGQPLLEEGKVHAGWPGVNRDDLPASRCEALYVGVGNLRITRLTRKLYVKPGGLVLDDTILEEFSGVHGLILPCDCNLASRLFDFSFFGV